MNNKVPNLITDIPGPKAKALVERDRRSISPSFVRWYPLVAKTGEGTTVIDVDGNSGVHFGLGF